MLCRKAGQRVLRGLGVGLPWPRAPEVENLETGCDSRRVGDQSRGGGEAIRRGTQRHGGIGKEITSGVGAGRCDSDQSEVPNGIFLRRNSDEGVPLVIGQRRRSFEMNGHQDSPSIDLEVDKPRSHRVWNFGFSIPNFFFDSTYREATGVDDISWSPRSLRLDLRPVHPPLPHCVLSGLGQLPLWRWN